MRPLALLLALILISGIAPLSALPSLPVASFTADPEMGPALEPIHFTDTSTGGPLSWYWDFGDGKTSTLQNPEHTYSYLGVYVVTLKVSNDAGSNTSAPKEIFMADSGTPVPSTIINRQVTTAKQATTTPAPASLLNGLECIGIGIGALIVGFRR